MGIVFGPRIEYLGARKSEESLTTFRKTFICSLSSCSGAMARTVVLFRLRTTTGSWDVKGNLETTMRNHSGICYWSFFRPFSSGFTQSALLVPTAIKSWKGWANIFSLLCIVVRLRNLLRGLRDFLTSSAGKKSCTCPTFFFVADADVVRFFRKRHWHVVKYFLVLLLGVVYKKISFRSSRHRISRERMGRQTHYGINNKLSFTAGAFASAFAVWIHLTEPRPWKNPKRN